MIYSYSVLAILYLIKTKYFKVIKIMINKKLHIYAKTYYQSYLNTFFSYINLLNKSSMGTKTLFCSSKSSDYD